MTPDGPAPMRPRAAAGEPKRPPGADTKDAALRFASISDWREVSFLRPRNASGQPDARGHVVSLRTRTQRRRTARNCAAAAQ